MSIELPFLNREHLCSVSTASVKKALRVWITENRPRCLKHPHGFYVMLLDRTDDEEWRLHLWPNGQRESTGMPARIHLHDTQVTSRLLSGALTNIQYTSTPVASGLQTGHPVYEVSYQGDRYSRRTANTLRKTSVREQVSETDRLELQVGDYYRIERYTLHEAWVDPDTATCTLVCMHDHAPGVIKLMGVDGYPDEISFARTEHDSAVFLDYL